MTEVSDKELEGVVAGGSLAVPLLLSLVPIFLPLILSWLQRPKG